MAFAQGSRSQLTYILESVFNTTPGSPAMVKLPINTHSVALQKAGIESDEIRSDRQVAVFRHGNKSVAGSIDVEFRPLDYDSLLEGALFGDFDSSNVLRLGTTFKSFSIEDGALDVSEYRVFTGCAINTFSMNLQPNAIVSASFGVVGRGLILSVLVLLMPRLQSHRATILLIHFQGLSMKTVQPLPQFLI